MGFVVVGRQGRRGRRVALDARMEQAGQFLADDGADHLEIVAVQHGEPQRREREVESAVGAFTAAREKRREICEGARIYAATSWGGVSVSLAAIRRSNA